MQCSSASSGRRPVEEAETDVEQRGATTERRSGTGERRRYNRRTSAADTPPPYYETFERIAVALEGIRDALGGRRSEPQPPAPRREDDETGA